MNLLPKDRFYITIAVFTSCIALSGCASQSSSPAGRGASANDWIYSRTITLDTTASGANVTEDVEKYPLAVLLDQSRFDFRQAQANGADLRFFDSAGKALPHAIELWDKESASAAVWVLFNAVKGNSKDQSLVMKWGHSSAPDISDAKVVFRKENGFVGVWHLDEDGSTVPDGYKDSSDHEAHGTGVGMIPGSRVDARIGKGVHLDNPRGQDTARWIRVSGEKAAQFNPRTNTPITVSIWARGHSYPIRSYDDLERRHLLDTAAGAVFQRPRLPMLCADAWLPPVRLQFRRAKAGHKPVAALHGGAGGARHEALHQWPVERVAIRRTLEQGQS